MCSKSCKSLYAYCQMNHCVLIYYIILLIVVSCINDIACQHTRTDESPFLIQQIYEAYNIVHQTRVLTTLNPTLTLAAKQ